MTALPVLEDIYPISPAMQAEFQSNGCLLLRGLCTVSEMAAYAEVIEDAFWRHHGVPTAPAVNKPVLRVEQLWQKAPAVAAFSKAKRFGRAVGELLGVPAVRLLKDEARFTEPAGQAEPWHQEQAAIDLSVPMGMLWMPLHVVTADMMGPKVALRSHKKGRLAVHEDNERHFAHYIVEQRLAMQQIQEMAPGDAIFLSGLVLQGAPQNYSPWTREVMTITYVDSRADLDDDLHPIVFNQSAH